jgi:hypothetical protein
MDKVNFINCTTFCTNVIPIGGAEGLRHIKTAKHRGVIDTSMYVLG